MLIEIISKKPAQRDMMTKRRLYEKYGVKEYWLVAPDRKEIEVLTLTLEEGIYKNYDVFKSQDTVSSLVLKDFHFNGCSRQ